MLRQDFLRVSRERCMDWECRVYRHFQIKLAAILAAIVRMGFFI